MVLWERAAKLCSTAHSSLWTRNVIAIFIMDKKGPSTAILSAMHLDSIVGKL
jgi:hypothetical protein